MTRIMITGANGFLGRHLARELSKSKDNSLMALSHSSQTSFLQKLGFQVLLRSEPQDVLRSKIETFAPEVVFHLAAIASAELCEREPERAWAVNVGFSTEISRLAVDNGAWLCALSTDLVFDGLDRAPIGGFSESDQTKPRSIYAKSKFEAENVVISSDPRAMVIRSSLIYGPEIGGKAGPLGWMHQAFSARQEVTLFGDEWRTPIYVADLTSVIHALIDHRPAGIWHLGGPERKSREEFGLAFALTHGYDRSLVRVVSRDQVVSIPARPRDVSLNSQSLCSKFRFTLHSLSDGLSQSRRFMHQNYS